MRLPQRRQGVTVKLVHVLGNGENLSILITANVDADNTVREVFCANPMKGSDMDSMLTDGCILISLLLQAGEPLAAVAAKMSELRPPGSDKGPPASVFGAILNRLVVLQEEVARGEYT